MSNEQQSLFQDLSAEVKRIEEIKKDLNQAANIIKDGIARYKKSKLRSRSKKQAEDLKTMFADLEQYGSQQEIQDAYGYDIISEREFRRLNDLWEMRKKYANEKMEFEDRVTQILDYAINHIYDPYIDDIENVEAAVRTEENERKAIRDRLRRERQEFEYDQYIKSIKADSEVEK